jgi:hypothetical protein
MIFILFRTLFSALRSHRALILENLALRHQLDVLKRNARRPRLRDRDRALWVVPSKNSVPFAALAVRGIPLYSEEGCVRTPDRHFVLTGLTTDAQNLRL